MNKPQPSPTDLLLALRTDNTGLRDLIAERLKVVVINDAQGHYELISAALDADDWRIREGAARALAWCVRGDPVPNLIAATRDEDPNVRKAAITSLARIGDERAVLPIIERLADPARRRDKDQRVADAALEALERLDTPEARAAINIATTYGMADACASPNVTDRRMAALMMNDPSQASRYAPLLVGLLADDDLWVRYYAVHSIEPVGVALKMLTVSPYRPETYEDELDRIRGALRGLLLDFRRPGPDLPRLNGLAHSALKAINETEVSGTGEALPGQLG